MSGRLLVARGARAAERALLDRLEQLVGGSEAKRDLVAEPVRVVVPSASLRAHLQLKLVQERRRAALGVTVETLFAVACEVIERAGAAAPSGPYPLELIVQRCARRRARLRPIVEGFEGGSLALVAAVRDLLDAGFTAAQERACLLTVRRLRRTLNADSLERAAAVIEIAAAAGAEAASLAVADPGGPLLRAAELLEGNPHLLPARAILVHGFAEATGVATRLLAALTRTGETTVFLDLPPDPADPAEDAGAGYLDRLRGRLLTAGLEEVRFGCAAPPPRLALAPALGSDGEGRAVAEWAREWLDAGMAAENLLVVVPAAEEMRSPLARHFERLGVPFSCHGVPPWRGPTARRGAALLALLRDGDEAAVGTWLAAWAPAAAWRAELDLALRWRGCSRLQDVPAALGAAGGAVRLPVRDRLELGEQGQLAAHHRWLGREHAGLAASRACAVLGTLAAWPDEAPVHRHLEALAPLLEALSLPSPSAPELASALAAVGRDIGERARLSKPEFRQLLAGRLADVGGVDVGGAGCGVQVCTPLQARGRTAQRLYLLGLNRGVFPREVRSDPILAEPVRMALREVLPEIPIKRAVTVEERYLFGHLLAAADEIVVGWQERDDEGRARPESPFVTRLRLSAALAAGPERGDPRPSQGRPARPLTAAECALHAAQRAPREHLRAALAAALVEAGHDERAAAALAAARCAVLDELAPPHHGGRHQGPPPPALGPFFGFMAPVAGLEGRLSITFLEGLARCPWQTFLSRVLGVEAVPETDAGLGPAGNTVGTVVHGVLEGIVRAAIAQPGRRTLDEALAADARTVAWPADATLAALLADVVAAAIGEGKAPPLTRALLRERAATILAIARDCDWAGGARGPASVGAEVEGRVEVEDQGGCPRTVTFRADRVDRDGDGVRLTDYKTGAPSVMVKRESSRAEAILRGVVQGARLQAAAYVAAAGPTAQGRYLHLRPDLDEGLRVVAVSGDDRELRDAFTARVRALLELLDRGVFVPKLLDGSLEESGESCQRCPLFEACLQHDSVSRARLRRVLRAAGGEGEPPAFATLRSLWPGVTAVPELEAP